jgi:hypothetical protein
MPTYAMLNQRRPLTSREAIGTACLRPPSDRGVRSRDIVLSSRDVIHRLATQVPRWSPAARTPCRYETDQAMGGPPGSDRSCSFGTTSS